MMRYANFISTRLLPAVVAAALLMGCVAGTGRIPDPAVDGVPGSEAEMYMLYPQLLHLHERYDETAAYYYLGDLESSILLGEELVVSIDDMKSTAPDAFVCDHLDTLSDWTKCLLQRVRQEELDREWRNHTLAALDSIASRHVVEDEIEIVLNWRTEQMLKYFQGRGRRHFRLWLDRTAVYRDIIEPILVEVGVPRDLLYLAVIESGLNLSARSNVKATGPWQFMSGTARLFGLRVDWWIDERMDIVASTYAAAHYLKHLHGLFGSWQLALASYNAGEYRVAHAVSRQKTEDYWKLRLPSQTRWFVPKYMAALAIGRNPSAYGFDEPSGEPLEFDLVTVDQSTDLRLIAKAAGCTVMRIKNLNPALKRWATPPNSVIDLKVPRGSGPDVAAALAGIPPGERVSWHRHRVKRGEALSRIAATYEISIRELKKLNGITNVHRIREGSVLLIPVRDAEPAVSSSEEPAWRSAPDLPDRIRVKRYAAPEGRRKIVYTVRDHDTLSEIAERFHVGLSRLRSWNDLRWSSTIHPGDRLVVYVAPDAALPPGAAEDGDAPPPVSGKKRVVHVVASGETLTSICRRYRARISDILAWNTNIRKNRIYPGDRITIWTDVD
ncbi:MAG: LysM peptidoglycan-binding domain-containing protein [Candidatus Krumholzibacteriota bacterium]|nr:LysM peptidoglycan-binding domain-containing protein [Candidatus Krumholzibacteriota bacterium]